MTTVIIVLCVICCAFCFVATLSIIADLIKSFRQPRPAKEPEQPASDAAIAETSDEKQPEQVEPVQEEVAAEESNAVVFSSEKKSFEERFEDLPEDAKRWFKEISDYAAAIEGIRYRRSDRYDEYKLGSARIVRLAFKRGNTFACEFVFENNDFKDYTSRNNFAVKTGVTEMRILDETMVEAAKRSIDIALDAALKQKEYRKQLAKERRRQAKSGEPGVNDGHNDN